MSGASAAAADHVEAVVARSRSSFALGMRILPKRRRAAIHAVYAFCREVDDIADEGGTRDEKLARLAEWRRELDRLYEGRPQRPVALALAAPVRRFDLPKREFEMIIEGMEMDVRGPLVAPPMAELEAYTRRVAGAVGLLAIRTFRAPRSAAVEAFALALADALQFTNILRDIAEDARIGRLYLPRELLETNGVAFESPLDVLGHPGLAGVCADLAAVARGRFAVARAALTEFDWRRVRPAMPMMGVYEAYLDALEARGWDKAGTPLKLSGFAKMAVGARYAIAPPLHG